MPAQILDFPPAEQQAIAAENALAATWREIIGDWFEFSGEVYLGMLDQTQLAYQAIMEQILLFERRNEAEEYGRLIREVVFEF
jgi:hypothetical protein